MKFFKIKLIYIFSSALDVAVVTAYEGVRAKLDLKPGFKPVDRSDFWQRLRAMCEKTPSPIKAP